MEELDPEIVEEAESDDAPPKGEISELNRREQKSRIFVNYGKFTLLLVIALIGLGLKIGQSDREERRYRAELETELSKPWLEEALRVLRETTAPEAADKEAPPHLSWAVDIFERYSPKDVPVSEELKKDLQLGALKVLYFYQQTKTHNYFISLSTENKDGHFRVIPPEGQIVLEIPEEFKFRQIEPNLSDVDTFASREDRESIFEILNLVEVITMDPVAPFGSRKLALEYKLTDPETTIDSFRLICSVNFIIDPEPVYGRPRELSKPSYDYGSYSYDTPPMPEKRRKEIFESLWKRK